MSRDHTERMMRHARVPFERDGLTGTVSQVDELELEEISCRATRPRRRSWPPRPPRAALQARDRGRGPELDPDRLLPDRPAHGRRDRRRAGGAGHVPDDEPVGDLDVAHAPLEGTEVAPEEVPLAIDELTLVALLGAFAEGDTVVRGAGELRHKESDRITATVGGLRGLGADPRSSTTASWCTARLAAARWHSTPSAITAWPCSARSPGWPPARASRS